MASNVIVPQAKTSGGRQRFQTAEMDLSEDLPFGECLPTPSGLDSWLQTWYNAPRRQDPTGFAGCPEANQAPYRYKEKARAETDL